MSPSSDDPIPITFIWLLYHAPHDYATIIVGQWSRLCIHAAAECAAYGNGTSFKAGSERGARTPPGTAVRTGLSGTAGGTKPGAKRGSGFPLPLSLIRFGDL